MALSKTRCLELMVSVVQTLLRSIRYNCRSTGHYIQIFCLRGLSQNASKLSLSPGFPAFTRTLNISRIFYRIHLSTKSTSFLTGAPAALKKSAGFVRNISTGLWLWRLLDIKNPTASRVIFRARKS